jgi:serine protease Do
MHQRLAATISIIISILIALATAIGTWSIHKYFNLEVYNKASLLGSVEAIGPEAEKAGRKSDLKSIIYECQKKVVSVEVDEGNNKVIGSGFLYDNKGDIITNAHVVENASVVSIKMADTSVYRGTVIGRENNIDVALIRVPELNDKEPINVSKESKADIGESIIALGSPLGFQNTATTGIISGLNRSFVIDKYSYKDVYQISASIAPGNSGGPLIDRNTGEAIGINSANLDDDNIGFSIPIGQVIEKVNLWASNPNINIKGSEEDVKEDIDEDSFKYSAEYLVGYFYDSLNSKDYFSAYSLLGSDWHGQVPYSKFRSGYLNTQSVKVKSATSRITQDKNVEVVIIISAVDKVADDTKERQFKVNYIVGYENRKLKILKGTGANI